jgi:molybdate transport system ATP-binding protein
VGGDAAAVTLAVSISRRLSPGFALDVTFAAPPGITIVFGASGSGKTTLLRCLSGLVRPDAGRISVGDRVLFESSTTTNVPVQHRNIGYVFQELALFPHLPISANLEYGLAHLAAGTRRDRTRAMADAFRISHVSARKPGEISGGERQRAALARSLVTDPSLLLLDEPLAALDHATQSRIMEDLRTWNTEHRIPILYVTHAHREVFALGARVIVLDHGRLVAEGTPHEVLEAPIYEPLAEIAGFENIFAAIVVERKPDAGTMHCRVDAATAELEAPLSSAGSGTRVRVAIRAGDILLATEEPRGLSARNVLRGRLVSLRREGATVIADVHAGAPFIVHLTPTAVDALGLAAGRDVWLIIKTHSCRIVSS